MRNHGEELSAVAAVIVNEARKVSEILGDARKQIDEMQGGVVYCDDCRHKSKCMNTVNWIDLEIQPVKYCSEREK